MSGPRAHQASCVSIGGRGLLIEGPPGSGKSSLVLALLDRGAALVGDDGVLLEDAGGTLVARPHPAIRGKLEVRNLGVLDLDLLDYKVAEKVPVALIVRLDDDTPRFVEAAQEAEMSGISVPVVQLWPGSPVLALRAECALKVYGRS